MPIQSIDSVLTGWGNYHRERGSLYRPADSVGVLEVLASRGSSSYIARGAGRSYGDSAVNASAGVLLQTGLSRFLAFDEGNGVFECEGGTTIGDIFEHLLPRGWFVRTTPGTRFVSIGGAIAADVHGKNHHRDGSFAEGVLGLDLLIADGSVLRCSREENAEVFWATIGGMGLTGIVLRARIQLRRVPSAHVTCRYLKCPDITSTLTQLEALGDDYRYSVAWIDGLADGRSRGRGVLMLANDATTDQLPPQAARAPWRTRPRAKKSVPVRIPNGLVNRLSVSAFNALYYHGHADGTRAVDYERFFYPLDAIDGWNRLYGARGFIQHHVLFPPETAHAGIRATLDAMHRGRLSPFLCVLKRCGHASGGTLSFLSPGFTLAMDIPNRGERTLRTMAGMERVALEHGGRIYLAKDATMRRETFERMYPGLETFRRIKRTIDPDGIFQSSQSRRLGIAP